MLYSLIKWIFCRYDPEIVQNFLLRKMKWLCETPIKKLIFQTVPEKKVTCMGLNFRNPVGLAAGLDKNGNYIDLFFAMGFGFIEIGTITPIQQYGNKKPRFFILKDVDAIINRMGFNNFGVNKLIENIKNVKFKGILGISIGKNKNTPFNKSKKDYLFCMEKIYIYADYIAINISSPNTDNLRSLQLYESLNELLKFIKDKQETLSFIHNKYVPIAVKISPDINDIELDHISEICIQNKIDGIIATNTTTDRDLVYNICYCEQIGGLSGKPLQRKSTEIIKKLSIRLEGKIPIIGVGGIDSVISAREKIHSGATLIQLYSGLIFQGPKLIKKIIENI